MNAEEIPWPRTCGFCRRPVEPDAAPDHWQDRARVSRCVERDAEETS